MTSTFRIGARVAYIGDPRLTGIVAGHGTVDNDVDPRSDDDEIHPVVIVALDKIEGTYATHMAFVLAALELVRTITTEDHVIVRTGDRAWNYYDLEWVTVGEIDSDGWAYCTNDTGGIKSLNGERLASKEIHPRPH